MDACRIAAQLVFADPSWDRHAKAARQELAVGRIEMVERDLDWARKELAAAETLVGRLVAELAAETAHAQG